MTKWKPAKRVPMISNGPRFMLGQGPLIPAEAGILAAAMRWFIPFAAVSGGMWLTSNAVKSSFPEIPLNKENLGWASALAGVGTAAYFIAKPLEGTAQAIAYTAMAASLGAAGYLLFKPSTVGLPTKTQNGKVPVNEELPELGYLHKNFIVTMPVDQPTTNGPIRSVFFDQEYEFQVTNYFDHQVSFFAGVVLTNADNMSLIYKTQATNEPTYGRKAFTVPADGLPHTFKIKVPKLDPRSNWAKGFALGQDVDVVTQTFRTLGDTVSLIESNPIGVRYGLSGIETPT